MNEKAQDDIYLLEQLVLAVMDQGKIVAASTGKEEELLEELLQITVALHFTIQTLKHRLGITAQNIGVNQTAASDVKRTVSFPSVKAID